LHTYLGGYFSLYSGCVHGYTVLNLGYKLVDLQGNTRVGAVVGASE